MHRWIAVFCIPSALALTVSLLEMFIPSGLHFLLMLLGPVLLAGLYVIVVVGLMVNWRLRGLSGVVLVTAVAGLTVFASHPLRMASQSLYLLVNRPAMDALVRDVVAFGKIQEMSDGKRYWASLNQMVVVDPILSEGGQPPTQEPHVFPLDSVLARDGIARGEYEERRRGLIRTGALSVEVSDDYVALVHDGFLDNLYGYVWLRPGRPVPGIGGPFVEHTQLSSLRALDGRWYFFVTT